MRLSVEDRTAIEDLITRYAFAVDRPDDERTFLDLFTEDAILDGPSGPAHGEDAVKRLAEMVRPKAPRQGRHLVTNILIEGKDCQAAVTAYFLMLTTKTGPGPGDDVEQSVGTYDLQVRKQDGVWRIARRVVAIDGA